MLYIVQPGFGILLNKPVLNEFEKHVFGENMQKEIIKNIHFSKYLSNYSKVPNKRGVRITV